MLELRKISKVYTAGDTKVNALKNVNLQFRNSEFVSILGPSGGGKTTLLNIIGGLDQYTDGDLIINGVSTKKYKSKDWDSYRNHTIGFVFQSYNLISHQSVLSNVELALTLAGISKKERRKRAIEALKSVGLEDQIHKKPNQMSGGQMQRVAIARALVNNPDVLLADEPTGALDTATSKQIMDLLKEIAKDKLVIMVTHNPDIAKEYSSRIIKILDGKIIDDSNPYKKESKDVRTEKTKKTSMNFFTALSLSFKNLLTKKGRTVLTAFAGSIGIIGIAAILALSNGVQNYIDRVEEDTLSSYPITIEQSSFDMTSVMKTVLQKDKPFSTYIDKETIYVKPIINDVLKTVSSQLKVNNLEDFKKYIETENSEIKQYTSGVQYSYGINVNIYKENDSKNGYILTNPNTLVDSIGFSDFTGGSSQFAGAEMLASSSIWSELIDNQELLETQYELVDGKWPENYNEVVLTVDENNQTSDYILYSLGLKNQDEINEMFKKMQAGEKITEDKNEELKYSDIVGQKFRIVLPTDYYVKENDTWVNKSKDKDFIRELLKKSEEITIVGIIRPNKETVSTAIPGYIGYLSGLEEYVITKTKESEIAKQQIDNPEINVFTGLEFSTSGDFDINNLSAEEQAYISTLSPEELSALITAHTNNKGATYEKNISKLGIVDLDKPVSINLFAKDFDAKEQLKNAIENYNNKMKSEGKEENVIAYSDIMGIMISSVTTIVDVVSYVLIAFVSISLIVSSIMIGIITYISVLERTKEIGILRAIGASKRDISRVFNAETLIVGLFAGCIGILITELLTIPANIVIEDLVGVSNIATLPPVAAIILICISVFLTVFAGLIPSRVASKKDPVDALRSE